MNTEAPIYLVKYMVPGGINMETQNISANLSKIKLDDFQIEQILKKVEEYIKGNETATTPIIEFY